MTEEHHEDFKRRLRRSRLAVEAVADWLRQYGSVRIPKTRVAPTHAESGGYKDGGDLFFKQPNWKGWRCYEIKGVSITFTGKSDYPYERMAVCSLNSWKNVLKRPQLPSSYITVSADLQHIGVVKVSTRAQWKVDKLLDGRRGYEYDTLFCPLNAVMWLTMEKRNERHQ